MNYYQVQSSRALSTLRDGSPNFLHTFGAINAGANEYVVVESTFPKARKYQPLMNIVITNNSGENLDLEINGIAAAPIPAPEGANRKAATNGATFRSWRDRIYRR